jgi:hypothetical protein
MSFDGVDDYIDCGNNESLDITGAITMSAWIKTSDATSHQTLFGKGISFGSGGNKGYSLGIYNTKIYFDTYDSVQRSDLQSSNGTVKQDEWFFLTTTWDGTTRTNGKKIYINGVLNREKTSTISEITGTNLFNFSITKGSNFFNGFMSDVRIYNRALSETEIKTLYNSYNPNIKMKTSLPKIKLYGGDKEIKKNGFIRVDKNINNAIYFDNPESNLYGKTYFYVMQYQARNNGGVPTSTGNGLPWTNISQLDAIQKSKDAGYHLITNWEWMAIARDIEQVPENWTGGAVGSGMVKRGNVGITDDGSYDGANPETGILNDKAKLKLSNGEEIYHFSGNVWEWVDDTITKENNI